MTDNLLQKLEEKMMVLLAEVENLRQKIDQLKSDNQSLRQEKENILADKAGYETRLQDLISLLDTVNPIETTTATKVAPVGLAQVKPMLI